jgi:hypothetical protein
MAIASFSSPLRDSLTTVHQMLEQADMSVALNQLWHDSAIPQTVKDTLKREFQERLQKLILEQSLPSSRSGTPMSFTRQNVFALDPLCNRIYAFVNDTTAQKKDFALVCKQFAIVAYNSSQIAHTKDTYARVRTKLIHTDTETSAKQLASFQGKNLSINGDLSNVCATVPSLKYLEITLKRPHNLKQNIPFLLWNRQITSLSINHTPIGLATPGILNTVLKVPHNLLSLRLSGFSSLFYELPPSLGRLKQLTSIDLTDSQVGDRFIVEIAQNCQNLAKINLSQSAAYTHTESLNIHDEGAIAIGTYCPNISFLDLKNSKITMVALKFLARNSLKLDGITNLETCLLIPEERRKNPKLLLTDTLTEEAIDVQAYVTERNISFLQEITRMEDLTKIEYSDPSFQKADKGYFGAFVNSQESAKRKEPLTIRTLELWHKLIEEELRPHLPETDKRDSNTIGRIRSSELFCEISIGEDECPSSPEVPRLLNDLLGYVNKRLRDTRHFIPDMAFADFVGNVFYRYVQLYPFINSNDKVGRLLVNYIATFCDRPVIVFDPFSLARPVYSEARNSKSPELMVTYIASKLSSPAKAD